MVTVTEGHAYTGADLTAGDRVFLLYQSANRREGNITQRWDNVVTEASLARAVETTVG